MTLSENGVRPFPLLTVTLAAGEPEPDLRANRGETVRLDQAGISWDGRGQVLHRDYREIDRIRLTFEAADGEGGATVAGICMISFSDGSALIATSGSGLYRWRGNIRAVPNRNNVEAYRDFIAELHARFSPEDRARISFLFGDDPMPDRYRVLFHTTVGSAFVVLPALVVIVFGPLLLLSVPVVGALILVLADFVFRRGPRPYAPGQIPTFVIP